MKKLASIVLVVSMLFVLSISAFAEATSTPKTSDAISSYNAENSTAYVSGNRVAGNGNELDSGYAISPSIPVKVNTSVKLSGQDTVSVYAVDIYWKSMTFTVSESATANGWDPDKLDYTTGNPSYTWTDTNNNEIFVQNRSSKNVAVELSFIPGDNFSSIAGNFYKYDENNSNAKTAVSGKTVLASQPSIEANPEANLISEQSFYFEFANETAAAAAIFANSNPSQSPIQVGTISVTITSNYIPASP